MNDKIQIQNSFEVLKKKYVGTGNPDITKWEWQTNIQRDLISSHIAHKSRLAYMSTALNEHTAKTKIRMLNRMYMPIGPPEYYLNEDIEMKDDKVNEDK